MKQIDLTYNQVLGGYYFYTPRCDYFFVTDFCKYRRKNPFLVAVIEKCLNDDGCTYRGMFGGRKVKDMLEKATIELKTCSHGDYYSIKGDGFGYGDFKDRRETKIYQV